MGKIPRDTAAMRRELFVTLAASVVGFAVMLSVWAWAIVRFVAPGAHWWDVLSTSLSAVFSSVVFGGLGSAVWVRRRWRVDH